MVKFWPKNQTFLKMGPTDELQTKFSEFSIQFGYMKCKNLKCVLQFFFVFSLTEILMPFTVLGHQYERKKRAASPPRRHPGQYPVSGQTEGIQWV